MKAKASRQAIMCTGLTGSRSYELYSDGSLNVVELFKNLHADKKGEHSSAVKKAIVSPCILSFSYMFLRCPSSAVFHLFSLQAGSAVVASVLAHSGPLACHHHHQI